MRTAVDSSVLLDVLGAAPEFGRVSSEALRAAYDRGALLACEVVWAEVRASYPSDAAFLAAVEPLGIAFDALSPETAAEAGSLWRDSRRARGPRDRLIADYLVGAHARRQADALLTRDRGFYRSVFRGLRVIDPSE